VFKLTYYSFSK